MKRSKINIEAALKQFNMLLPDSIKEPFINGFNICKDKPKGLKDQCEAGFTLTKCMQENIKGFVFP